MKWKFDSLKSGMIWARPAIVKWTNFYTFIACTKLLNIHIQAKVHGLNQGFDKLQV